MADIFMAYKWWLQPNRSPLRSVLGADDPPNLQAQGDYKEAEKCFREAFKMRYEPRIL